jgi:putative transposase
VNLKLFLAVVLDAWSRRIVGRAMASDLRPQLVLDALDTAVAARKPADVVHHNDQDSQYTSPAFGMRCREAGIRPSTGSVGDADDNAPAEAFLAALADTAAQRDHARRTSSIMTA